jgi:phospholipid/cholesterol/gamma-HCH transport system substrate-binding protein
MITRAAVTAAVLSVIAVAVGGAHLIWPEQHQPLTVTAHFDNAVGLYAGNTVAVLGMPVGRVASIEPGGDHVNVVLEIDPGVDIPADVQAVTVGTSILTDRHVELTPPYTDGPTLRSGDVLGLESTRTPVEFDRVLKMVDKLGSAMSGDGQGNGPLADITTVTAEITSSSGEQIKAALASLADALRTGTDGGAATKANIDTVVTELSRLTDAAAQNEGQVREFGSYVRQVSDILAEHNIGGGDTGRRLNELLSQINDVLDVNGDHLTATVGSTARLSRALVDYRRELAEVFDVAPLAIDNVSNAIDSDNGMLRVGAHFDSVFFDSSMTKEVCNILGLRQLGCRTGTITDLGPDFGVTSVLEAMSRWAE